jgi:hypothetical protein
VFSLACRTLRLKYSRTRPYRPRTNRKAERFIPTMLAEWAYAAIYGSSKERTLALSGWLERYNMTRRYGPLGHRPPIARLPDLTGTTWLVSTAKVSFAATRRASARTEEEIVGPGGLLSRLTKRLVERALEVEHPARLALSAAASSRSKR